MLPEVVVRETVDHRRRRLDKFVRDREAVRRDERWLLGRTDPAHLSYDGGDREVERLLNEHEAELRAFFTDHGQVWTWPTVGHDELVSRVLSHRAPLRDGERGYRDALIWYTALEVAQHGPVILLSPNVKDFGDGSDLATDLVEDVVNAGFDRDRIELCTSLSDLLRRVLPNEWNNEQLDHAWSTFATSSDFLAVLGRWFEQYGAVRFGSPPALFPRSIWDTDIESIESVEVAELSAAAAADDGWYLVNSRLRCVAHPGGMIWETPLAVDQVPSEEFVLWGDFGTLQSYLRTTAPHTVEVTASTRFRPPNELADLSLDSVRIIDDAAPSTRSPAATRRPLRERLEILRSEAAALAEIAEEDPWAYGQLIHDESHVAAVAEILEELAIVSQGLPPALMPDNLANVLSDPAGVRRLHEDLENVIGDSHE